MNRLVVDLFEQIFGRKPTSNEHRCVEALLQQAPAELREDPGFVAEQVFFAHHLSQMDVVIGRIGVEARQLGVARGEELAQAIAKRVWRTILDNLPTSSSKSDNWYVIALSVMMAVTAVAGLFLGYSGGGTLALSAMQTRHAASDRAFVSCIDAAHGYGHHPMGGRPKPPQVDGKVFVQKATVCAAEYADRRAAGA